MQLKLEKLKKKNTLKTFLHFLIFWEMELSSCNIKKFLVFSYIFQERETLKNIPNISGNRNLKKHFIFQEQELLSLSSKN